MKEITLVLTDTQYNAIYGLCNLMEGTYSRHAGSTMIKLIGDAVRAASTPEDIAKSITIEVKRNILDGVYLGMTEVVQGSKCNAADILTLTNISRILKVSKRFVAFLDVELSKIPQSDDSFLDDEIVDEPLDDE